jgi:hypothetical protein
MMHVDGVGGRGVVTGGGKALILESSIAGETCQRWLRSLTKQQHLRHRQHVGMRDRQQRRSDAHAFSPGGSPAMQPQLRRAKSPEHFDILPEDSAGVAGSQGFHRRFLRGKPPGQVRHRIAALRTIGNLSVREYTAQKTFPISLERAANSRNVGRIDSQSEDVHDSAPA